MVAVKILASNDPPARRGGGGRPSARFTALIIVVASALLLALRQLPRPSSPSTVGVGGTTHGAGGARPPPADANDSGAGLRRRLSLSDPKSVAERIPQGLATALPPARGEGGNKVVRFDPQGVSPTLWTHMVSHLGVRSVLDLGCGWGISTSWFVLHGLRYVVCAEGGTHNPLAQSLLPAIKDVPKGTKYELVEHDFSRGPWWPERIVDAAWCVNFAEHVKSKYMPNYHAAFRKAALIFVTHSNWGGDRHVEVHPDKWWRKMMEADGFVYSKVLTDEMRKKAYEDKLRTDLVTEMKTKKKKAYGVANHLWATLQVYVNPLVAKLPGRAHLFAEYGCYDRVIGKKCKKEGVRGDASEPAPLPEGFERLKLSKEMDDRWMELIKDLPL